MQQFRKYAGMVCGTMAIVAITLIPYIVTATTDGTAPTPPGVPIKGLSNPLNFDSVQELVYGLVDIAMQLGVVVAALSLIWVGFKYVAARGNPKEISAAHNALLYTLVGIAILFGAKVIVEIIKGTIRPIAPELFKNI